MNAEKALMARHDALAFSIDKDRSVKQVLPNTLSWRVIQVAKAKWIAFASRASDSKDSFSCCCHEEYAVATDAVQVPIERIRHKTSFETGSKIPGAEEQGVKL